jgi:hypothetical protein
MRFVLHAALTTALMTSSAGAEGTYTVRGAGISDCASWTADQHDVNPDHLVRIVGSAHWILGFLSGVGYAGQGKMDPLRGSDSDAATSWISNYCATHPRERILDAAKAFVDAHAPRRSNLP